ncbi:MAG TPA: adenylate/guanylate cyclase domain-containing protein [Kiritimatiellia bacterium]|nr:adenylate/guanylate cyclase domain-containing protein [Kiritimatiellia bacterium]HPS09260.1 adenylate/guanylate cyclase domain-containing protein [Kiritimatiellia bacterium]
MDKRILQSLGVGCGAAGIALLLWQGGLLDRFEYSTWAWRVNVFAALRSPSPDIKVVLLDQASLDWGTKEMGWSWPWPREVYAPLLDFCRSGGAKVIAFDVLFTEPSVYGVADDEAFGAAIRRSAAFVGAAFYGRDRVTPPIPAVATNATVLANVSDEPDPDGVFRRATLLRSEADRRVSSLGYAAWQICSGAEAEPRRHALPLDTHGRLILNFAGTNGSHQSFSAAAIIQSGMRLQAGETPPIAPSVFSNAYVFVGFSAPGLMDLRPTPISRVAPGVEIHATVLDNLLTQNLLRDAPKPGVMLVTLLLACLSAWRVLYARNATRSALAFAVCLPTPIVIGYLAYAFGYWWPVVVGLLALAGALVGAVILSYATEGRQKAFIKNAFRHYLGEEVIDQIIADPGKLMLGGEKRELTVFFSDIEKFSTFSERLDPVVLTSLLNDYLSDMSAIIKEEGGYLDKYIGDAIVAFWNAPVAQPDHAARACRAALRCQRRLAERRHEFEQRTGVVLRARIGINTGDAIVGNMGSRERFNYTILGDAANLASRLEGANKAFGTYLMVSESTWRQAGDGWIGRELACLRVVGRKSPVRVFEPAGFADAALPESWADFETARRLFEQGRFAEALPLFARWPADAACCAYAIKCRSLTDSPPDTWSGIWELNEK